MYHFCSKIKNRVNSSVAAVAAYRIGKSLIDPYDGRRRYSHRAASEVLFFEIFNWDRSADPLANCQSLIDEIGRTEVRINSRLWREAEFALPREGSQEQKADLARGFTKDVVRIYGVAAVLAGHAAPKVLTGNEHCHLLLTTREVVVDENGYGLGSKVRSLDDKDTLKFLRKLWEIHLNNYYRSLGLEKAVSCLSHQKRGLNQLPTIHLGPVSRSQNSDRREINRQINEINESLQGNPSQPASQWLAARQAEVQSEISNLRRQEEELLNPTNPSPETSASLNPRQRRQLKSLASIVLQSPDDYSPLAVDALETDLGRRGKAGGALSRLRKSLSPSNEDPLAASAFHVISILDNLFKQRNEAAYAEMLLWRRHFSSSFSDFAADTIAVQLPQSFQPSTATELVSMDDTPDTLEDSPTSIILEIEAAATIPYEEYSQAPDPTFEILEEAFIHHYDVEEQPAPSTEFASLPERELLIEETYDIQQEAAPDLSVSVINIPAIEILYAAVEPLDEHPVVYADVATSVDTRLPPTVPSKSLEDIIHEASEESLNHAERVEVLRQAENFEHAVGVLIRSDASLRPDDWFELCLLSADPRRALKYVLDHKDFSPGKWLEINKVYLEMPRKVARSPISRPIPPAPDSTTRIEPPTLD